MTLQSRAACVLLAALMLAGGGPPVAGRQKKQAPPRYTVPANTSIRLRLNERLSSKDVRVGQKFTSTVVTPIHVRGVEVIPAGSIVTGSVTHVERAERKSEAGSINVTFSSLALPNNARYAINGSLATSASEDNEGEVKGKSSKKKNAAFIGGGLVVGGLIGGGSGALVGGSARPAA